MARILILEAERGISDLIALHLGTAGHTAVQAFNGREAQKAVSELPMDLLIIDVIPPEADGAPAFEKPEGVPAIYITALDETAGTVRDLVRGTDDCIVKPFEMPELLFRVETALRRSQRSEKTYRIADFEIDFEKHAVKKGGEPVELTLQEYALLETLIKNRNVALSRQRLMREAWNIAYMGETRTVDVHVQRLRKKLGMEDRIKTVYKFGYRFEETP